MPYQTDARRKLTAFLQSHRGESLTAEEVAQSLPDVNPSTVYRNLNLLAESGDVIKSVRPDGHCVLWQWHERQACKGHLHLRCESCGRVIHLDDAVSEALKSEISTSSRFEVDIGSTEITGRCAKCRR